MRREFRTSLLTALLALPMVLTSSPALAGIITDLKIARPVDRYQPQMMLLPSISVSAEGNSSGSNTSTDEGRTGVPFKHPRDSSMLLPSYEYAQIEAGLITPEEAISGCGGAQVAGGNAGWGPLALVGLFLALRRRT